MSTPLVLAKTISEQSMTRAIVDAVAGLGGRTFYARDSRRQALTDEPDLRIVLPNRRLYLTCELKSWKRPITPGQQEVAAMLREVARFESFIVRPCPRDESETSYDTFLDYLIGEQGGPR